MKQQKKIDDEKKVIKEECMPKTCSNNCCTVARVTREIRSANRHSYRNHNLQTPSVIWIGFFFFVCTKWTRARPHRSVLLNSFCSVFIFFPLKNLYRSHIKWLKLSFLHAHSLSFYCHMGNKNERNHFESTNAFCFSDFMFVVKIVLICNFIHQKLTWVGGVGRLENHWCLFILISILLLSLFYWHFILCNKTKLKQKKQQHTSKYAVKQWCDNEIKSIWILCIYVQSKALDMCGDKKVIIAFSANSKDEYYY